MDVVQLIEWLSSPDRNERLAAAESLAQTPDVRAADALCFRLADPDRSVRSAAALALSRALRSSLNPTVDFCRESNIRLCGALLDKGNERFVRFVAAQALGMTTDAEVVRVLCSTLGDADVGVYSAAADSLTNFGDLSILPLCAAMQDPDGTVRIRAEITLARIRRSTRTLVHRIIKSTALTTEQVVDTLDALKGLPRILAEFPLQEAPSNLGAYCRSLCRSKAVDDSVKLGAAAVLDELERRANPTTLLRASRRSDGAERSELLRGNSIPEDNPREMLRGSRA